MGNYRELIVWQKAMKLAAAVYRGTENFPSREMYGLTAHLTSEVSRHARH